jgi:1-hydroxycarotenoid 3,4-desaturase
MLTRKGGEMAQRGGRVVVIGAGIGGLVAALELAAAGCDVTVLERAATPGGKLRQIGIGDARIDAGPTVFTMRWVFDAIFERIGARLEDHLTLTRTERLARHAWDGTATLDLFTDVARSADAIGAFAGAAEARGYKAFAERAGRIFTTLDETFMRAQQPGHAMGLARRIVSPAALMGMSPFATLWSGLAEHFKDRRLLQLFGRYATYCGSSPWLAPATLMLVAHAERRGVWLVEGGMHQIARSFAALATARGATFRYNADVAEITTQGGRVSGVKLADGEAIAADAVVCNGDIAALFTGLLGRPAAAAVTRPQDYQRSLSALTWALHAPTSGFPLLRHNVFFSDNYKLEFDEIFQRGRLPSFPTVYVCAQDRGDDDSALPGPERLLVLSNAPARSDTSQFEAAETAPCETSTYELLQRCGLAVARSPESSVMTTPAQWNRLFPATGGALYGMASHGAMSAFRRPGSRTKLPGLYLAGGSAHPGPGVPMAALSGRLAAASVQADLVSTSLSRRTATRGGMSTR